MAQLLTKGNAESSSQTKSGICNSESSPYRTAAEGKDSACMISTPRNDGPQKNLDDLNRDRFFEPYMRVIAAAGAGAVVFSVAHVPWLDLGLPFLLLVLVTVSLGSRIVVRFFRFDSCISVSDIFIFLA